MAEVPISVTVKVGQWGDEGYTISVELDTGETHMISGFVGRAEALWAAKDLVVMMSSLPGVQQVTLQ